MKKPLILIIVLAILALYGSFINSKLKIGSDSVDYYRLAESIRDGRGYTIEGTFISKWPPMTPLLMAFGLEVFHAGVSGQKILLGTIALAGLVIAYWLLRRRDASRLTCLVVILTAVSFPFIYWVIDLSSEGPYFFLTMAALLLGQLAFEPRAKSHWAILTGVCIGLAVLTRTVGFALLGGFGLYMIIQLILQKKEAVRPSVLILLPALLLVGGWFGYAKMKGGETSVGAYGKYGFRSDMYNPNGETGLKTVIKLAKDNLIGYAFIFSAPDASLRMKKQSHLNPKGLFSLAIMGLALIGFLYHLFTRPQFPECYLVAYGGILLIFNWYDIRYMVPILPLLFYYFAWSIQRLCTWITARIGKPDCQAAATTAVLILLILVNTGFSCASAQAKRLRSLAYDGPAADLYEAAMWIKANDPQAVIMCRSANMTWFWTRMPVEGISLIGDPKAMWQHLQDLKVTMVIDDIDDFSGVTGKYLDPALAAHQDKVEEVKVFGKTRVLRIHP